MYAGPRGFDLTNSAIAHHLRTLFKMIHSPLPLVKLLRMEWGIQTRPKKQTNNVTPTSPAAPDTPFSHAAGVALHGAVHTVTSASCRTIAKRSNDWSSQCPRHPSVVSLGLLTCSVDWQSRQPPPKGPAFLPAVTPPCVTFRLVVAPLRGLGQSPVLPFACCVGLLLSVGRGGRCSCWWRFRVRGAQ